MTCAFEWPGGHCQSNQVASPPPIRCRLWGDGIGKAERYIRARKEQRSWVRTFETDEELRRAPHERLAVYNERWLVERHG